VTRNTGATGPCLVPRDPLGPKAALSLPESREATYNNFAGTSSSHTLANFAPARYHP
jgi:hypothetical protein